MQTTSITFKLSEPTIFKDYNKQRGYDEQFTLAEIKIQPLKYKHLRAITNMQDKDQMHHLMQVTTGLSEHDIGELNPSDAAGILKIILSSMQDFYLLGQKMMKGDMMPPGKEDEKGKEGEEGEEGSGIARGTGRGRGL